MKIRDKNTMEFSARIEHPKYGYVEFYGLTIRQKDILSDYIKLKNEKGYKLDSTTVHKKRTTRIYSKVK